MTGTGDHMFTFENRWFRLVAILTLFAAAITILVMFHGVLLPFVFAIVVAYVMEPLVRRIHQRPIYGFVVPRWTCVIFIYLCFFAVVAGFVIFFVPPMYRELRASVEGEWASVKAEIEKYVAVPPPVAAEDKQPDAAALDQDVAAAALPGPGDAAADPAPTREQLRLTDWDGEVVWVPRRLGPVAIHVYSPDKVDAYLKYLEARRADETSAPAPPLPAYSSHVRVVSGWSIEAGQLQTVGQAEAREETIAHLGERTELRFRHLGSRPEGALVEIVYPATEGSPEIRDYMSRELPADDEAAATPAAARAPDLYGLGKEFVRKQARNAFNWFTKEAEGYLQRSVEYIAPVVGAVFKTIFTIFLVLMIAAFISSDLRSIQRFFFELVPPSYRPQFEELTGGLDRGLSGVIRGQLLICLINGTLTGIGLYFMKVPFWHVLTLVVTVLTLIPIFGTILSSIPCVLFGLTVGFNTAIVVLIWILAIHALEAYVLNPKIMGHSAHIHPVLVVFALVSGEQTYGLIGALLAVPFASILQNLFLFVHKRLVAATEEEAQRTGLHFKRKPKIEEEEDELRRRAREEAAKKRTERGERDEVKAEQRNE